VAYDADNTVDCMNCTCAIYGPVKYICREIRITANALLSCLHLRTLLTYVVQPFFHCPPPSWAAAGLPNRRPGVSACDWTRRPFTRCGRIEDHLVTLGGAWEQHFVPEWHTLST
jgi:hypothetical protein